MSSFADQASLKFSEPAQLKELVAPAADSAQVRIRGLIAAVYEFPFGRLRSVQDVQVHAIERQKALFPPRRTRGTWTRTVPSHMNTDVLYEDLYGPEPVWLDIAAEVALTLVLELDPGEVESVLVREIDGFNTLNDFRARFRFIDVDAFMAQHKITNVQELREAFYYLLTEIRMKAPLAFDPQDPANRHSFTLQAGILIRDTLDIAGALRDAKLVRISAERALAYRRETNGAEARWPLAPLVVFPAASLNGTPFTEAGIQAFYAAEHLAVAFVTP